MLLAWLAYPTFPFPAGRIASR